MQTDTMPALGYGAEATYDPADDKLRLRTVSRLCAEDYQRAKAAGFAWAPKQGCFFASWTPERADLLEEWCGEIQDEGSTLEERAAERAERFEGYSERREADGDAAHARVAAITDGIPLGQPILVGHHSERHARRDAKRIENGMRRAVKMWETAEYWQRRARAAVANAERRICDPGVRTRRIAKLATDLRGFERDRDERRYFRELWEKLSRGETILRHKSTGELATLPECARYIALAESSGVPHRAAVKDPALDDTAVRAVAASAAEHYRTLEAERQRWVDHTEHRIAYEREALGLEGADASAPLLYKAGGSVEYCGIRRTIERVANRGGATVSLRLRGYRASIPVDAVRDYQAPDADAAALPKPPPILNYRLAEGETLAVQNPCREEHWVARQISMTTEEYGKIPNDYKATRLVADGSHRVRSAMRGGSLALVHLTDGPQHARPEHARPVTN